MTLSGTTSEAQARRIDLETPAGDRWATAAIPPGWEPVAALCLNVRKDAQALTEEIVLAIEREVPTYRDLGAVPRADLTASVASNLEMILLGIAERRGPTEEELAVRRELGTRRAMQGHPVDALIQAFQVGYREIWQYLVDEASDDPVISSLLLSAVTTLWQWVHEVSNAVTETHLRTTRSRELVVAGLRQRFLELLMSGDLESDELSELTRSLGFDPDGYFRATCVRAIGGVTNEAERVGSALSPHVVCQPIARGHDLLVISQAADDQVDETQLLNAALPDARIGGGLRRIGLAGARLSVGDAERATLAATSANPVTNFENDWVLAMFLAAKDRLHPILDVGIRAAREHPEFAEAVEALAGSGFSVSEAARRLFINPNTVVYRIKRWQDVTGWDPRTFEGAVSSMAAIKAARVEGEWATSHRASDQPHC